MVEPETRLTLETPGGIIEAIAECRAGKCERVRVHNVPSFTALLDGIVEVPGLGAVAIDIAYDGAFFAIVDAVGLGFSLTPDEARDLVEMDETIKAAVVEQYAVVHPEHLAI